MTRKFKIESLLAARLFMNPQLAGDKLYFISNMSGRMSLYRMDKGGSVPEPLLPPDIALQNPTLLSGRSFVVFPDLGKIIVSIDNNGDENYQPYVIPVDGGIPELLLGDEFAGKQLAMTYLDLKNNVAAYQVDHRTAPEQDTYLVNIATLEKTYLGASIYGNFVVTIGDQGQILLADGYTNGDTVYFLWNADTHEREVLLGKPIEQRKDGEVVPLNGLGSAQFTPGQGLLFETVLFDDLHGLGYLKLASPQDVKAVGILGLQHSGIGELEEMEHLKDNRYLLVYNIDGVSWCYEAEFDEDKLEMRVTHCLVGKGALANGVLQNLTYNETVDDYALTFSTATSPVQVYTLEGPERDVICHTHERVLGIAPSLLSPGEDASFISHDGLRVSARLYLPASDLGYTGKLPVIFYIHGGPQSQERPDFTWFSMPMIQYLTLHGYAVFVPNVRGSHGYGMTYMKMVDRDWGGADRLDHVAAFDILKRDPRLDMGRAGVMGRSYGGYMTLIQVGRHPDLWGAAVDMFGPYDLFTFMERLPDTWQTYFHLSLGHPEKDKDHLIEMSPKTYLGNLACPMLVIQGRNDPRVVAAESEDLVAELKSQGKDVALLLMENEGHDVLKYENRVWVYNAIVDFFNDKLKS